MKITLHLLCVVATYGLSPERVYKKFPCQEKVDNRVTAAMADRREFLSVSSIGFLSGFGSSPLLHANAAVGSLLEFADTNAILQGFSLKVADQSQQRAMLQFLKDGFDMKVLRQRIQGPIEEVWMGYGPEQLSIPPDFQIPVSSFSEYGGHSSIRILYDKRVDLPLYRVGDSNPPGTNVAYIQLGVPGYRISQMIKNGGNVLDAYGIVNVLSPSGIPFRGVVGISPDPIMFVAINCDSVQQSKSFYQQLGFQEIDYPYARPNQGAGPFEPSQPPKSVYMAPTANGAGVLLLPSKKKVTANPAMDTMSIVYSPAAGSNPDDSAQSVFDPSGVQVTFQSVPQFENEEKITR